MFQSHHLGSETRVDRKYIHWVTCTGTTISAVSSCERTDLVQRHSSLNARI
jgi:hypothetical protein